ncbi:MlaD family protein [Pelagibacterium lentulum]|uniref:ABC transporter substrate-binding protein n=1 Tax=Pelagibacterium lentulum TaxID=2029865 RepID=A0A916R5W3_9HYPH|nr:MlaD family protein [Pelagibacterium lentulum]GGA35983.1 ABC transporter substrate-binding protein [Pelagibacterium lentulum]
MEYKANHALVGVLATLLIAGFAGFIYWFNAADTRMERVPYEVVFTGSVSGLGAGTNVLFNGIRVGNVTHVGIDPRDPSRVIARISVNATAPVMNDTRAILEVQGLTGMANIQLLGGTLEAGRLEAPGPDQVATLQGEPSDFQMIMESARDIVASAESTFSRIDGFFSANEERLGSTIANIENISASLASFAQGADEDSDLQAIMAGARATIESASASFAQIEAFFMDNQQSLGNTVANAEVFTAALAQNADGLESFLASMTDASNQIGPLADELRFLTTDVRALVEAVPPEEVRSTVADIGEFANALARNTGNIDEFFDDARTLAENLSGVSGGLQATLDLIDTATANIDPEVIGRAMDNIDRFSLALGDNATTVDTILTNARDITETLTGTADRVDAIVAQLNSMVESEDGSDFFGELAQAATAVRMLAERLDVRTAEITAGLTGFTNRGLGEYTQFAAEARGTLRRLDRILTNFERNPQILVFGGQNVRDFQSR